MNVKTHGLRKGELVTIAAGSGVGKSSFCRHIALDLLNTSIKLFKINIDNNYNFTFIEFYGTFEAMGYIPNNLRESINFKTEFLLLL